MIRFPCPNCGKTLKAPEDKAGAKSRCPTCWHPITVPTPITNQLQQQQQLPLAPASLNVPFANPVNTLPAVMHDSRHSAFVNDQTPKAHVPCPLCNKPVQITAQQINRSIRCQSCFQDFVVNFGVQVVESHEPPPVAPIAPLRVTPIQVQPVPVKPIPQVIPVVEEIPVRMVAPAPPPPPQRQRTWIRIMVSARLLSWPKMCAACCGPAEGTRSAVCNRVERDYRTRSQSWSVPYCQQCNRDIDSGRSSESVRYEGFYASVHTFDFWNPEYSEEFRAMNRSKVLS